MVYFVLQPIITWINKYIFQIKHGSNFTKQHSETVMIGN